jgi:hypothetical protein
MFLIAPARQFRYNGRVRANQSGRNVRQLAQETKMTVEKVYTKEGIAICFAELSGAIDVANQLDPALELGGLEPAIHHATLRFEHPVLWAKVLMETLAQPPFDCDQFGDNEKTFWAKVAMEIGPDWIAKFRRVGAFMSAVEKA